MQTLIRFSALFWLLVAMPVSAAVQTGSSSIKPDSPARENLVQSYGKLPLSFEANQGQTDPKVTFLSRGEGYQLYLTRTEAILSLKKPSAKPGGETKSEETASAIRMKLIGGNPRSKVSGAEELPGKSNYFVGRDPARWRSGIPTYAKVRYEAVYPGIDLIYYGKPAAVGV